MIAPGFALALQHQSLTQDTALVCKLLCTSKSVADAVHACMKGTIAATYIGDNDLPDFVSWLHRNAGLLRCLYIDVSMVPQRTCPIAKALQHAACTAPGLLLQSVALCRSNSAAHLIMQQLPGRCLTRLDLAIKTALGAGIMVAARALAGLTNLQSVSLGMYPSEPDKLMPAVAVLTSLTELNVISGLDDPSALRHLPQQLLSINLWTEDQRWYNPSTQPPHLLPLGHLTACTSLCLGFYGNHIKPEDVLPPNLQHLVTPGCPAAQPLLPLARLGHLVLYKFTPGPEMQLMADALTSLTAVHLGTQYLEDNIPAAAVEDAARAWLRLPLKLLRLGEELQLSAVCLQHVAQLQGLTWLDLDFRTYEAFAGVVRPLADALAHLRNLSVLQLQTGKLGLDSQALTATEAVQQDLDMFLQALGNHPRLSSLLCRWSGASPAALVHLSAAKCLTSLVWWGDVTDSVLNTWAWRLTGLQSLSIRSAVTDGVLPTVARTLTNLRSLDLSSSDITDLGVQCLSTLKNLTQLQVSGDEISMGMVQRVLDNCKLLRLGAGSSE